MEHNKTATIVEESITPPMLELGTKVPFNARTCGVHINDVYYVSLLPVYVPVSSIKGNQPVVG